MTDLSVNATGGTETLQSSVWAGGVSSFARRYFFEVTQPVSPKARTRRANAATGAGSARCILSV